MERSVSSRLRAPSIVAAAVIVLSSFALALPAHADTNPTDPTNPATPATVTADALPAPQINGVVWTQEIVGNTVYAGGQFTTAQPAGAAAGVSTVTRSNILSYNLTTGVLNTAFAPVLNGQVKAIAASPDGSRIYVGGAFTTVNGANAYRVAALDPTTGAMLSGFAPTINATVNAIAVNASTVYLGGVFTSVNKETHTKVVALTSAGKNVANYTATADGGDVTALAVKPDGTELVVGGNFTSLDGSSNPGYGLGAVDTTGALLPFAANGQIRNAGTQAAITSLQADSTGVYGSGYTFGPGTLEGSFRADWSGGAINWLEDCHGDTYEVSANSTAVYVAGHPHYCGNIGGFPQTDPVWTFHRALAFSKSVTQTITADPYGYYNWAGSPAPSLLNWYPEFNTGTYTGKTQGPWSVASTDKYVVYGGEFTTVNGQRQQGLVRFAVPSIAPKAMGPQASGAQFVPTAVSQTSGTVRLSWTANSDPDNSTLTYNLYRNGNMTTPVYTTKQDSSVWNKPSMGFIDTGLTPGATTTYRLRATDPDGNTVLGNSVSVTVSSKAASAYTTTVLNQGASSFWRLDETSGTAVIDSAGFNDMTAGTGVSRGTAGATSDADTASTFDGTSNGLAATQSAVAGPQTFSVEAWVKTTSTAGGKIVGFGNSNTGTSSSYDRHLYMGADGKVNFGVYNGNTQTLTSPTALNDGQWHQVVGSLSSSGMQFFVDGKRVGTRTDVTSAQVYNGYWRIGGDSSWYGANFLSGSIDDVSVYPTPLTQTQVNNQYVAAGYASQLNTAPADNYGSRVFTDDPYLYYRLGDASGATAAADSSLSGTPGAYTGGVTKGTAGAISGTTNTAATFDGSTGQVNSTQSFYDPEIYSVEAWFKTTTTTGGKIVGFGSSATGQSGSYDRHVYMQDNGQLVFGTYTGVTNTITTAGAYNDGSWHQVVATQSSAGLKLYVDGVLQGTNPATQAQAYTGYWKIGGDTTWGSTSAYFKGSIDEVAIYDHALAASTISDHYALGTAGAANAAPTASFTSSTSDLTASFDASASADSDGTVASYAWDFGDGTTATGKTPSHTFATAGTKTVTLTVTDDKGATGTATAQVVVTAPHVNAAPTASFTSSVTNLSAAFDASASADSDGTIASYAWTFGDGGTATGKTPTHAYTAAGTYSVKLTVTDNDGATASSTSSVTVTAAPPVNQAPTAAFTQATANLKLTVDGTSSSDADGTIASYAWTFGDGGTATTATATHTYASAGSYTVKLTVTDNGGATASSTQTVTVTAPANVAPTSSFTTSATNLQLTADGSGSSDPDGTIASYAWTFGDGGTSTVAKPTYTYATAGTYTVTLKVTDNQGATNTSTATVTVTAPAATPFALDAFGRTVTNGFGTADTGGAWTRIGAATNLSVSGGAGKILLTGPAAQAGAYLGDVAQTDTDLRLTFSVDKAASGGGTYLYASSRRVASNNEYRALVRLKNNGTAAVSLVAYQNSASATTLASEVVIPGTINAGTALNVRLQTFGTSPTTIRAKVWLAGTTEPSAWTVSATDSSPTLQTAGAVGVLGYVSGSANSGAQVMSISQLSAFKP